MLKPIESNNYSIYFKSEGYKKLAQYIQAKKINKILILTDDNTKKYCLEQFRNDLSSYCKENIFIHDFSIKSGEASKNFSESTKIIKYMLQCGFKRNGLVINLGGGMISDIGGFVASIYMRGLKFINIPTTLLAMVDASIGGKNGIDFNSIKNLIGTFNFPVFTIIDSRFLKTLSKKQLISGFAEIIKHSLINSNNEWKIIQEIDDVNDVSDEIIYNSILIKNHIINKDPYEKNVRKYLNYGHTLGHAIESYFLNKKDEILHGEAISVGLILETYISHIVLKLDINYALEVKKLIFKFFKKIEFTNNNINEIVNLLKHDKKNKSEKPLFVLIEEIGKPVINQEVSNKNILDAFKFYAC